MSSTRLMNVTFASVGGEYKYVLACNSSDNKQVTQGFYKVSDQEALGQVGCLISNSPDGSPSLSNLEQTYLYKELENCGYTPRVALLKTLSQINVKMYLNGMSVDPDGNPMPYVVFETPTPGSKARLNYYRADGTFVDQLLSGTYSNAAYFLLGKLMDDGTMRPRQYGFMKPHYNVGIPSTHRYEWYVAGSDDTVIQVVSAAVVDDLKEYYNYPPEGFAEDDGEGDFDTTSDAIGIPGVPTISILGTGFVRMYEVSASQLQDVANYLWDQNNHFDTTILKNFQDPMEAIVNLCMCPIEFTGLTQQTIAVGNLALGTCTGQALTTPYKRIDFGTIYLNEFWGNYADYSPNTKISIFLPYAGVQNLEVNDVMNGGINLWANCDVFTGSIQYFLFSAQTNHRGHGHNSVLYTWSGNMKYNMPFAGSNFNRQIISAVANIGTSIGTMAMGGTPKDLGNMFNPMTVLGSSHVQRGGGWGGIVGALGHQYPYLILERPELSMADNYNHSIGVPNETTNYLKNFTGYVKVKGVHMKISTATANELNEIESLLKGGVIV